MSIIYSDEELMQIEKVLGKNFVFLYDKLWNERNSVKNYRHHAEKSLKLAERVSKEMVMYWEYKLEEVEAVLLNQSKWLRKVAGMLKGKVSDEIHSKLENYLNENDPQV